jgi:hypothetical protein
MIVIRRMVDRRRAYTGIFLKGEPPQIFPTSDAEHARILQVYKQDRPHEGILNDFSDVFPPPDSPRPPVPAATPHRAKKLPAPSAAKKPVAHKKSPRPAGPLWLTVVPPPASPP